MDPGRGPSPAVLSSAQVERFQREGLLHLEQAFPRALADALRDEVWRELREEHGIAREDSSTWRTPPRSPRRAKHHPLNEELADSPLAGAIAALLGEPRWRRPASWGGFLVGFPADGAAEAVPSDGWHWDGSPRAAGLLVFSFYSHVRPGGGGTQVVRGSHRVVEAFYASLSPAERALPHKRHRELLSRWHPWLAALTGNASEPVADRIATFRERTTEVAGVPCRVVELCGAPGDAVLCNLGLLHCAAPNRSPEPRVMRVKFLLPDDHLSL